MSRRPEEQRRHQTIYDYWTVGFVGQMREAYQKRWIDFFKSALLLHGVELPELPSYRTRTQDLIAEYNRLPETDRLDMKTPYFNAQLDKLPPQQEAIFTLFCDHPYPLTIQEIQILLNEKFRKRKPVSYQTLFVQLRNIVRKGYLSISEVKAAKKKSGRRNDIDKCYEVRDPELQLFLVFRLNDEFSRAWSEGKIDRNDPFCITKFIHEKKLWRLLPKELR